MKRQDINIRDPYVLVHEGFYYLYGTRSDTAWSRADGFDCYVSRDLSEFDGPFEIFHRPEGFFADRYFWAPECYAHDGAFYLVTTFGAENLKQGIFINLILLAVGVFLFLDLRIVVGNFQGFAGKAMYVVIWLGIVLYAMIFVYIYPLLSRFYNTIRNTFINAILISIRHLPKTVLLILLTLCPILIFFIPQAMISSLLILLFILVGFATLAYAKSMILVKILDNYMPPEETTPSVWDAEVPAAEDAGEAPVQVLPESTPEDGSDITED